MFSTKDATRGRGLVRPRNGMLLKPKGMLRPFSMNSNTMLTASPSMRSGSRTNTGRLKGRSSTSAMR